MRVTRRQAKHPDRIRILTMADLHETHINPSGWKASYQEHQDEVWDQICRYAKKIEADAIAIAGDIFHRKRSGMNPTGFLIRLARKLKRAPCDVLVIAGNHDVRGGTIVNGLDDRPLGALIEMNAVTLLDENPREIYFPEEQGLVTIRGSSFHHGNAGGFLELERGDGVEVHLGHFNYAPEGGEFFGEKVYGNEDLRKGAFDIAVIGHHHYDQGVRDIARDQTVVAVGSVTWTGVHDADSGRRPAAGVIEVTRPGDTWKVTTVRLTMPALDDLVDPETRREQKENREQLDQFAEEMKEVDLDPEDPLKILSGMEMSDEVRRRAGEYLAGAEEG